MNIHTLEIKRYTFRSVGVAIALVTLNMILVPMSTEATFLGYTGIEVFHTYMLNMTFWEKTRHIIFLYLFPLYIVTCYVTIGKYSDI